MAFQRLSIHTRKSIPGLGLFDSTDNCHNKTAPDQCELPIRLQTPKTTEECALKDFGATLERCKVSPSRDSPSKRKKLLGSLRSLRSLANLHASPSKTKQDDTPSVQSSATHRYSRETLLPVSPSLALLPFQQSPSNESMFELGLRKRSISGCSLEVLHSSPMTVPGSVRQMTLSNILPFSAELPAGTVPDTPGPMQRAFDRDPTNQVPWQSASPTPLEQCVPSEPVLTPLPGTNLTVGDLNPELIPLPPSINSSQVHIGSDNPGYFDVPVEEQPPMHSAEVQNALACLRFAERHGDTGSGGIVLTHNGGLRAPVDRYQNSEGMRREYDDAKLQDTLCMQDRFEDQPRTLCRPPQANEPSDMVGTPNAQQAENVQGRVRKDSTVSEDWETSASDRSTGTTSQYTLCKGLKSVGSSPTDFAYIVWESPTETHRIAAQRFTWSQHTGLPDDSGHESNASKPVTFCDPNVDTKVVHIGSNPVLMQPSAAVPFEGHRSGKRISSRPLRSEGSHLESVRDSPLTVCEQRDQEVLESIYHAYTVPLWTRGSGSSDNSAGANIH